MLFKYETLSLDNNIFLQYVVIYIFFCYDIYMIKLLLFIYDALNEIFHAFLFSKIK